MVVRYHFLPLVFLNVPLRLIAPIPQLTGFQNGLVVVAPPPPPP
jgi:hypothetical protein